MRFKSLPLSLVFCVLLLAAPAYSLEVTGLEFNAQEIGKYRKLQIDFHLDKTFDNPYDPHEIRIDAFFTAPSGKIYQQPAFYTEDHRLRIEPVKVETKARGKFIYNLRKYDQQGEGYWQIRFSPDETGDWKLQIVLTANSAAVKYPTDAPLSFSCIPSGDPGFLHPDPKNNHYLRFDNGEFFFGVGLNAVNTMGACADGIIQSFDVIKKLAAEGGNMSQIDLCQGDYLEWTDENDRRFPYYHGYKGLGRYNQQTASQIDRALATAESLGVYLRFTFFHWADFGSEPADGAPGLRVNPYWENNGGPLRHPSQFFTDKTAGEYQKKLFRYIIARWGYSPHIICWELWNEVDNTMEYDARAVGAWHRKTADYLKSLDPRHMVTTSTSDITQAPPLFQSFNADIVTFHDYVSYNAERPFNIVDNLQSDFNTMRPFHKPIIPGEFGYEAHGGLGEYIELAPDSTGIDVHNQLWGSLMTGMAATAMPWFWGKYIDHYKLFHHYKGLSRFAAGEDLSAIASYGPDNLAVECSQRQLTFPQIDTPTREEKLQGQRLRVYYEKRMTPNARVLGLISPHKALIWVQDQGSAWINYAPLEKVENAALTVNGMDDGRVKIEYWNTFTGVVSGTAFAEVSGGKIKIDLPPFKNDMALKIYHLPED